jgi:Cellulose biosynthesis protein BcsS
VVSTAVAFLLCGFVLSVVPSRADDEIGARTILFSGRDLWRNGAFAYGGLLIAPGGFEQDGFMFKLLLSGGLYRYNAGGPGGTEVKGGEWLAQALPGFRIKRGNAEMKFFFGPEWQHHNLWPDDPGNRLRGKDFGLRVAAELWYEPTPLTLIAGDVSLGTVATSQSARLAFGWRVADEIFNGDGFYIGPETQVSDSDGYRHWRLGTHITSLKTEATEWSAALGYARDSGGRSSPYVRLNLASRLTD